MADKKIKVNIDMSANLKGVRDANTSMVQMARSIGETNKTLSASALRAMSAFTEIGGEADKAAARHVRSAKEIEDAWKKTWKEIRPKPQDAENAVKPIVQAAKNAGAEAKVSFLAEFMRGGIWTMASGVVTRIFSNVKNTIKSAFSSAFRFETMTSQFKTLVGSIDEARAHMADLKALGDTPPFSLDQFAAASRALLVMTDGALGFKKSLELVGDAAAATGHPIEALSQGVGYLYASIRDGQPLSRAVMQLRRMGVITPEVATKLQEMQSAGESNVAIWAEVESALGRYAGAMKNVENTGDGLMGAISSQWDNIVRAFGQALEKDAKGGLRSVLDSAKELQESGHIERWATATASALGAIARAGMKVAGWIGKVVDHVNAGRRAWSRFFGGNKDADGGEEESFELVDEEEINSYTRKRRYSGSKGSERIEIIEDEQKKKEHTDRLREAEEEDRKRAALEEGDRKRAERAAKEKARAEALAAEKFAEKAAEADARAAEKAARERERLDREEAMRRERMRQKDLADRIRDLRAVAAEEQRASADAQSLVAAATAKEQRAWGWYRDKGSLRAQLDEEKANAEAERQFEREFERLRSFRRDWRTAKNLSIDEEAVRRVGIAREEKSRAEEYAKATAESAQRAADALVAIQSAVAEGGGE